MKLQSKISYSTGALDITERFATPPAEIPAEPGMQHKAVWEHVDLLLRTGEPKGDKKEAEYSIPQGPHMTAYFNGIKAKEGCCGPHGLWAQRVALLGQSNIFLCSRPNKQ